MSVSCISRENPGRWPGSKSERLFVPPCLRGNRSTGPASQNGEDWFGFIFVMTMDAHAAAANPEGTL